VAIRRALLVVVLVPPLALAVVALLGDGVGAGLVGLGMAGLAGGAAAWLAFASESKHRNISGPLDADEEAASTRLLRFAIRSDNGTTAVVVRVQTGASQQPVFRTKPLEHAH
jgi:hypothetical protein